MRALSLWPNYLQKAPPPNTINLSSRFSTYEFWGQKYWDCSTSSLTTLVRKGYTTLLLPFGVEVQFLTWHPLLLHSGESSLLLVTVFVSDAPLASLMPPLLEGVEALFWFLPMWYPVTPQGLVASLLGCGERESSSVLFWHYSSGEEASYLITPR